MILLGILCTLPTCLATASTCLTSPCGVNAICTDVPETGRTCACPLGFSGDSEIRCCDTASAVVLQKASSPFAAPEGQSSQYALRLSSAPSEVVVVTVQANDSFSTIENTQIVFGADNFSTPQNVLLSATDDNLILASPYSVLLSVATQSADECYDEFEDLSGHGIRSSVVPILVSDNDQGKSRAFAIGLFLYF